MGMENITMNLDALQNITPLDLNVSSTSTFTEIVNQANFYANDYIILASMFLIFFISYFMLSDKTPFGEFGYDDLRGVNIAAAISTNIGLTIVSVGWSSNFVSVGMFIIIYLLTWIAITIYENRE